MYATNIYLYQQIQEVLLIDISGAYFNARWNPVYAKNLKLNLGVDNVILFQFLNQDQKPVNISGATFTFRIISQDGTTLLYAKELVALSTTLGRAKVTIPAVDTLKFQAQPASYSIEISSGVLNQAVLTDDYTGARGDIDIVDSVFPMFVASNELTIGAQAPVGNVVYSSTITTDGTSLTTFQIHPENYTGNISVQGATAATPQTVDWYDIDFEDLTTGNTVSVITLSHSSSKIAFNVEGFHPYLRLEFENNGGNTSSIDVMKYR